MNITHSRRASKKSINSDCIIFPGFPENWHDLNKSSEYPTISPSTRDDYNFYEIYNYYLYHSSSLSFNSFLNNLIIWNVNKNNIKDDEKNYIYNDIIFRFRTQQHYAENDDPIPSNCIVASNIQSLKLIGLIPVDFKINKFENTAGISKNDPRSIKNSGYSSELIIFFQNCMEINFYNFMYVLGSTGNDKSLHKDNYFRSVFQISEDDDIRNIKLKIVEKQNNYLKKLISFSPLNKRIKEIRINNKNIDKFDGLSQLYNSELPVNIQFRLDEYGQFHQSTTVLNSLRTKANSNSINVNVLDPLFNESIDVNYTNNSNKFDISSSNSRYPKKNLEYRTFSIS